jgi:succinate-semialdehyde dehydrogenase/glutarate-semialdehyde dehydrogenase
MDDADLHRAVAGTIAGAYLCSGQSCTAAERILVHERVHDAFVEALAAAVGKEVVLGDPFDPRTHLPFGGGGGSASGVGRVGGRYAMEALTQVRTVVLSGLA